MGKARSIFLNFIYIVLLVEVALSTGKIDTVSYSQSNIAIENSIDSILSRHRDMKQYYSDYLGKLQEKDKDYDVVLKIKQICENEDFIMQNFKNIKENLIISSGGYNKKQTLKHPADKSAVSKILVGNRFLENFDKIMKQRYDNGILSYDVIKDSDIGEEVKSKNHNFDGIDKKYKDDFKNSIGGQYIKNNIEDINPKNQNNNTIVINEKNEVPSVIHDKDSEVDIDDDFDDGEDIGDLDVSAEVVNKDSNEKNKSKDVADGNSDYVKDAINSKYIDKNSTDSADGTLEFKNLTLVEALLKLSQKQLQAVIYNESLLQNLVSKVAGTKNSLDSFDIIVTPKHNVVVPGEDFEADIRLVANNSFVRPKYKINNKDIDVIDGIGKIKIPSPKNIVFDANGISRQSFNVKVEQYDPYTNKDIVVNKEVKYDITKKSNIDGQYATMESLYRHCGNKYKVRNLAPEINSDISFKFKGGEYKILNSNQDEYELLLIPNDDVCYLHVYNKSKEIEKFKFNVVDVKIPTVSILFNSRNTINGEEIQLQKMHNVEIHVLADEYFKNHFNNESEYKVKHFSIIFCSGQNIVKQESVNGERYSFGNEDNNLIDIDRLIIRIDNIVRVNCNKIEIPVLKNGAYFDRNFKVLSKKSDDEDDE